MATETSKYFLVLILGVAIGVLVGLMFLPPQILEVPVEVPVPAEETKVVREMMIPAVTNKGNGAMFPFGVEIKVGNGHLLVDLGNLVFIEDTQNSIKKARTVASVITQKDVNHYDITYFSDTEELTIIGGESAGAALTILTIAALEDKPLLTDIAITGAVTPNGSITKVGAVAAKAKIVGERGYAIMLVPPNQASDILTEQTCEEVGEAIVCRDIRSLTTAKDYVSQVIEVSSIYEALPYFGLE